MYNLFLNYFKCIYTVLRNDCHPTLKQIKKKKTKELMVLFRYSPANFPINCSHDPFEPWDCAHDPFGPWDWLLNPNSNPINPLLFYWRGNNGKVSNLFHFFAILFMNYKLSIFSMSTMGIFYRLQTFWINSLANTSFLIE